MTTSNALCPTYQLAQTPTKRVSMKHYHTAGVDAPTENHPLRPQRFHLRYTIPRESRLIISLNNFNSSCSFPVASRSTTDWEAARLKERLSVIRFQSLSVVSFMQR